MQDIKNRCMAAKEELSINLHTRLRSVDDPHSFPLMLRFTGLFRWVMYVERTICDVDSKLVLYHETLKKLRRRLEILQQMHMAPSIYCSAVVEVVRRRDFSQHFIKVR
jgi:RB1-inducible coiled-coil protein 1